MGSAAVVAPALATAFTFSALAAVLVCERASPRLVAVFKPLASLGFLLLAVLCGAFSTAAGVAIFVALVFSFGGDVFLIPRDNPKAFLVGLASFLLGHVAYGVAFLVMGVDVPSVVIAGLLAVAPALYVVRWLWPTVPAKMKSPVIAYICVITVMVALSVGASVQSGKTIWLVAALMFYLSDITVARQRFVVDDFRNRWIGLPLYYAAQVTFAWALL